MDNKSPEAFRTISEVADWLGVPAHVLRFWESRFGQVKPVKRAGGRRYYRPSDMELLGGIRKLLHEDGMTIRGVQKLLRENGVKFVAGLSPPIDQPADLKDVGGQDAGVSDTGTGTSPDDDQRSAETATPPRGAPVVDSAVEDAVEIADTPATSAEAGPAPEKTTDDVSAESAPAPAEDAAEAVAAAPEAGDGTPLSAARDPEDQDESERAGVGQDTPELAGVDQDDIELAGAALGEIPPSDDSAPAPPEDSAAPADVAHDLPLDDTEPDDDAPAPLDGPEAIDFFAHEAQPDTGERAGPPGEIVAADTADPGDGAPAMTTAAPDTADAEPPGGAYTAPAPDRTVPEDLIPVAPVAGPDPAPQPAPDAPASGPDTADTPEPTETEAPAAPSDTGHVAPAPATPADLDLVMPDIGPDPEDDAPGAATGTAAALRRHRTAGSGSKRDLNPALLQAYADRLQALSGRLGATPDGRRPF